jgi:hypothetical protein
MKLTTLRQETSIAKSDDSKPIVGAMPGMLKRRLVDQMMLTFNGIHKNPE